MLTFKNPEIILILTTISIVFIVGVYSDDKLTDDEKLEVKKVSKNQTSASVKYL